MFRRNQNKEINHRIKIKLIRPLHIEISFIVNEKYTTIRSIVCEASCHHVSMSSGSTGLLRRQIEGPYK